MSNPIFDNVFKYYSSELVYFEEFQPQAGSLNAVYFPYCKYTLDYQGLLAWFKQQTQHPALLELVVDCLFNKDKEPFSEMVQQSTQTQEVPMNMKTLFPDFNPESMLNVWWGLPTKVQNMVKSMVPDQDSWTLQMKKDSSGVWVFSLPQFMTFNESMCNGTEKVMDYWFEQKTGYVPVTGSTMDVTVSKKNPMGSPFDTKLSWMYEDPYWSGSNYYLDTMSGMDVWLCPYVQVLFKGVPESMWCTFTNCN
jgi:hypothetical protein